MLKMTTDCETSEIKCNYQCEFNVLTRPDGSAILNQNGTIMIAAIYGPLEAKLQRLSIDKSVVEAHYRPKTGLPGVGDRLKESMIRNTCETALLAVLYPRTSVSVVIQEVQNCGQILACAVNAACFAMLNSGIEMKFLVAAVSCVIDDKDTIVVNPSHLIIQKAKSSFTFVFDSIKQRIVASHTAGIFTEAQYKEAISQCRNASNSLFVYYKQIIREEINKNDAKV